MWLLRSLENLYLCKIRKLLKYMCLTLMHPKQAGTSIYTTTWHTQTLQEQHIHILLENDPQEPFGLIKNETDFDLTGAKFFLQVNAHTGMNRKTCFYAGEEKHLLDFQAVCLLSCNSWFGERTRVHKAAPFCTVRQFVLARERTRERLIYSYLQPRGI